MEILVIHLLRGVIWFVSLTGNNHSFSFIRVEFYEPFFRPTLYLMEILVQEESRVVGVVNNEI